MDSSSGAAAHVSVHGARDTSMEITSRLFFSAIPEWGGGGATLGGTTEDEFADT